MNHNVETVPRLYSSVRPIASFEQSLELLKRVKQIDSSVYAKSGMMLGLGEKNEEELEVMKLVREAECDFFTVGQYLTPTDKHHPVVEYVHPDVFEEYRQIGEEMCFSYFASAPLVRSSYMAVQALI